MARPDGEQDHKCCGVVEEAAAKSKRRRDKRRSKPQPWLMLKFTVAFTLGIIGYASYVYIGRFCVPMIRKNHGALGGRRIGIPFLVIFCILLVMMLWAYVMVVFTGPGKAKDFVQKSEQPKWDNPVPRWWDPENDIGGGPYQYTPENTNGSAASSGQPSKPPPAHVAEKPAHVRDGNVGEMDAVLPLAAARTKPDPVESTMDDSATQQQEPGNTPPRLPMMYTRAPPTNPVLLPEYRYCQRDGFVKPLRAHHCRACGTCVLKYDHHCPWIGQCVGALNHKFFVHFLQWAAVFCMWSFATLVAGTVNMSRTSSVDPEFIVAIALSGLFIFFTVALLITHIRLIILNQSTVDSLKAQHMKEREKAVLARMFSWYQFGEKRKAKKEWDREWGDIDTEGNIWWLGSARKNWEAVMGHSVWEWFLPIGRSSTDGVNWPINPRFDSEGRWRPRREWPPELR